jgi:predicted DNA-binding protein
MATNKRVFTLRLSDEVFDKIGILATNQHRSMTNYVEYVLLKHIEDVEKEGGPIRGGGANQEP